jgi:hypothetical protein
VIGMHLGKAIYLLNRQRDVLEGRTLLPGGI